MFDLVSEQIGPTATHNKQPSGATNLPTRLQSAPEEQILAYFLQLTFEERIARFGAATGDDAIRAWREGLDRGHYIAVSLEQGHRIAGLVELFGSRLTGWQRPELALSTHGLRDKSNVRLHLLGIGLGLARERGARDVYFAFNLSENCMVALARQYGGTLDHQSGTAVIPCDFISVGDASICHAVA
jgi:hypothetical protein